MAKRPPVIVMMPEEFFLVQKEIRENHPNLWLEIQAKKMNEAQLFYRMNDYLNINLQPNLGIQDTCITWLQKLQQKRTIILLPPGANLQ